MIDDPSIVFQPPGDRKHVHKDGLYPGREVENQRIHALNLADSDPGILLNCLLTAVFEWEPPIGIEPMTYALRGCSRALLAGSKAALASCSQVAAGGNRWLLMAVRGHLGDTGP